MKKVLTNQASEAGFLSGFLSGLPELSESPEPGLSGGVPPISDEWPPEEVAVISAALPADTVPAVYALPST